MLSQCFTMSQIPEFMQAQAQSLQAQSCQHMGHC
jgi:hypothetical protein